MVAHVIMHHYVSKKRLHGHHIISIPTHDPVPFSLAQEPHADGLIAYSRLISLAPGLAAPARVSCLLSAYSDLMQLSL